MAEITQEHLKSLLDYDPATGHFTWKVKRNGTKGLGSVAGCLSKHDHKHYVKIIIDGHNHFAHRLAFIYVKGCCPHEVDHRNLDGTDNRWCNLRGCSHAENSCNTSLRSDNTSGCKGVYLDKKTGKWYVQVSKDKVTYNFGFYEDYDVACAVVRRERENLHKNFARNA